MGHAMTDPVAGDEYNEQWAPYMDTASYYNAITSTGMQ